MSSLTQANGLPGNWKTAWPWTDDSIIGPVVRVSSDMTSWLAAVIPAVLRESPWLSGFCVVAFMVALMSIRRCLARRPVQRRQLVQNTLDSLPDAVALFNAEGRLTAVNRKLSGLMPFGIDPAQYTDMGTSELYAQISPDNDAVERAHQRAKDASTSLDATLTFELPSYGRRSLLVRERNTSDGGKSISVFGSSPLASHRQEDPLTSLANRTRLVHELGRLCSRTRSQLSLIIVDLRSFRQINDTYGRCAGDELLRQTAHCLRQAMPADALIARTAGDEFAILLEADHDHQLIESILAELLQTLRSGLNVNAMNVPVRASIGIAYAPEHGNTVSTLLKSADSACAHAKYLKGNSIVVYNSAQQQQAKRRHQLEIGLQRAIERDELALQYQPQIDIRSKMTCGMEALLRWHSSEFGGVPPSDFIPVAEETGIIHRLGEWVLNRAVSDYQRLSHYGMSPSILSVNLSRKQFEGSHIVPQIERLLSETGFDPTKLCLEITETALARDTTRLRNQLLELTSMGVRLAIDDFGVGYSSLLELRDYPISEVKIDRAFIVNIANDTHSQDIVAAVVDISRSIGAEVVAEGIETQQQFDMVAQLGCDRAQGYFLCEPMAATTFPDVVLSQ